MSARHAIRSVLIASALLACVSAAGCARTKTAADTAPERELVVMVYMIGSDLEADSGLASADIQEMLQAEPAPGTEVLLIAGGSPRWGMEIPADTLPVYRISDHALEVLDELPLSCMTEPDTLSSFLRYAYDRAPEARHALILWDHGMGPMEGYGVDLLFGRDHMTLRELSLALENSPFSGEDKLIWIGFDACLMASLETAVAVKDHAWYLLASQEVEPRNGWDYSFLSSVGPRTSAEEQLERIRDAYLSYYTRLGASMPNYRPTLTLSCLDLRAADDVVRALDSLFDTGSDALSPEELTAFVRRRSSAVSIGRFTNGLDYDLVDLGEFIRLMDDGADRAAALRDALSGLIVWSAGNADYVGGVSIYCPGENLAAYDHAWKEAFSTFSVSEAYYRYMDLMVAAAQASRSDCFETELIPTAEPTEAGYRITLDLTAEQARYFSRCSVWIFAEKELTDEIGGKSRRWLVPAAVFRSSGYDEDQKRICADFDGRLLYSTDDDGAEFFLYTLSPDRRRFISPCSLNKPFDLVLHGYDFDDLSLYCELQIETDEAGNAGIVGAILDPDDETDFERRYAKGKKELDLNEWSWIEFYSLIFSLPEDGHTRQTDHVAIHRCDVTGEIEVHTRRADTPLYAMLLVTDLAGAQYESQVVRLA